MMRVGVSKHTFGLWFGEEIGFAFEFIQKTHFSLANLSKPVKNITESSLEPTCLNTGILIT